MAYLGSFDAFGWLGDLLRAFAASWVVAAAGVLAPAVADAISLSDVGARGRRGRATPRPLRARRW